GCTASMSINVGQDIVAPDVQIISPDELTCSIVSVTLVSTSTVPGASYNWGGGNNTNTNNVSLPGSYEVTVTDPANGCTSSATTTVTQNLSTPNVSIATPSVLTCLITNVTLVASSITPDAT